MRMAIVIARYYPFIGGAEVFAQEVAEYMTKKGAKIDVLTLSPNSNLKKIENVNNVTVHRIMLGKVRYFSFFVGLCFLLWHTLKLDKERNYDLIHSVGEGLPSIAAITFKKLRRKPCMITIQGGCISGGFTSSLTGKLLRTLTKWIFKNADLIHVISRSLAREAKKLGGRDIVIIPNGFNSQLFHPLDKVALRSKSGISTEDKIIISVARLTPVKGIDNLIRATSLLVEKIPGIRLIVIGDGAQREELEKLVYHLHLDKRVQLLGFLPHQQIPEYLCMADVFVLPSIHEGLGISLIEAMACGVPVIGSRVDGITDIIDAEKNGILVAPGDVKALADGIVRLLCNKNLRDNFINEGFKKVVERFLWDSILQQIEEITIRLCGVFSTIKNRQKDMGK